MWEVIIEKDKIEVSQRWIPNKKKAEAFAINNHVTAVVFNTKIVEQIESLTWNNGGR